MPKGPRGEKRPADVVGAAVKVAKIATGEIEDERYVAPGRKKSGRAGGVSRAERLTGEERRKIAKHAAHGRWDQNERRRAMVKSSCDALADRVEQRVAERDLVDVKFFLGNPSEASLESVCDEVMRLYDALEKGDFKEIESFEDSYND